MGFYIEVEGHHDEIEGHQDKALRMAEHGAWPVYRDAIRYGELPEGTTLLCVVRNGPFDAVAICYDSDEFRDFNDPDDRRLKTWMLIDTKTARDLCPKYNTYLNKGAT